MSDDVQVDVIILSWNRTADTIAAINSALEQEGVIRSILVVDQGSTPACIRAIRLAIAGQPDVKFRELGRNVGVASGRNIATRMGHAPYIVALDNDAIFPDKATLARAVRRFEADPKLGAVAFRILNYFTGTDDTMCWDYPPSLRDKADQEFQVTRFVGAGYAMRRDAYNLSEGYDDALFFVGEERDICYRILNQGYRISYIPDLTVLHKVDPEARVRWDGGRYYYTIRNTLYIEYKYRTTWPYLLRSAGALALRGFANGIPGQTLRGLRDAARMGFKHGRRWRHDRQIRISNPTLDYIRSCERRGSDGIWARIRRQFEKLPDSNKAQTRVSTARPRKAA